jgi:DNA-binding LytR/AlgR family response regulator
MPELVRTVVVEVDNGARTALVRELRGEPGLLLVGEARGAGDAVQLIERRRPHLALVPLALPGLDALTLARLVRRRALPLFLFLGSGGGGGAASFLRDHGLMVLGGGASPDELRTLLREARERALAPGGLRDEGDRLIAAADEYALRPGQPYLREIAARDQDSVRIVPIEELVSIESDGPVIRLETAGGAVLTLRQRLPEIEQRLDPLRWLRFSKGLLVNRDHITGTRAGDDRAEATLSTGRQVVVSATRVRALRDLLPASLAPGVAPVRDRSTPGG